jgi:hypothetical protein
MTGVLSLMRLSIPGASTYGWAPMPVGLPPPPPVHTPLPQLLVGAGPDPAITGGDGGAVIRGTTVRGGTGSPAPPAGGPAVDDTV